MSTAKPQKQTDDFMDSWVSMDSPALDSDKNSAEFHKKWVELSSAKLPIPAMTGSDLLRRAYPNYSIICTQGSRLNILGFPGATVAPLEKTPLVNNLVFNPLSRRLDSIPGILIDSVEFGIFRISWQKYEFLVHLVSYILSGIRFHQYFIIHEGEENISRLFLLAVGAWTDSLHDEIWVFNQSNWFKDHGLWNEIQKANWADVILKDQFKKDLQKDVFGFFKSEQIYEGLSIPWKRGLIMYGPPGNGKTISLKAIMKACGEKGYAPLYVMSFKGWRGEEGNMAEVFQKARQLAPCVMILEDLDSLINDDNRSFFLNQLDGIEGNDGILIIGTTNHFDRLDPGLSARPSRFDRKYNFDNPDVEERKLYVRYWQTKLASNKDVDFPQSLADKIVRLTNGFSFAYLKESFVAALVVLASADEEIPKFADLVLDQIAALRKELDKSADSSRVRELRASLSLGASSSGRLESVAKVPSAVYVPPGSLRNVLQGRDLALDPSGIRIYQDAPSASDHSGNRH